jgi:hypothetical protein
MSDTFNYCNDIAENVVQLVCELSVLVIMYPGKWPSQQFLPNCNSVRIIDWFEGTGTIIGIKRNRVYILSSIHCTPRVTYSFFLKGTATQHTQVPATLVQNYFVPENNGIDIAVFSCDASYFAHEVLCKVINIEWTAPDSFELCSPVWLVHYPTSSEAPGVASTHRLDHECQATVSNGTVLSEDFVALTIDATIVATGGSSGGLVIYAQGRVVDS